MKGLSKLLADSNISNLRLFLDRFKPRIIEMATRDVDLSTRLVSIETLIKMSQLDLLDSSDFTMIVPMIFDADSKIRGLVSKMLPKILVEKQDSFDADEFPSNNALELHCLCSILIESDCSLGMDSSLIYSQQKDDELSLEDESRLLLLEKEQKELLEWYSESWTIGDLHFDGLSVRDAVKALWDVLPLVRVFLLEFNSIRIGRI